MNPIDAIKANRHATCTVQIHGVDFVFRIRRVTSATLVGSTQLKLLAQLPPDVFEKMVTGEAPKSEDMARDLLHKMRMMSPDYMAEMASEQKQHADDVLMAGVIGVRMVDAAEWTPCRLVPTEDDEKQEGDMALTTFDEKALEALLKAVQAHCSGGAAKAAASFRRDEPGRAGDAGDADDAVSGAGDDGARVAG